MSGIFSRFEEFYEILLKIVLNYTIIGVSTLFIAEQCLLLVEQHI